jgi:hypothetical protein
MEKHRMSLRYRGMTDRRYQDWHYTLPQDWDFIDLDGLDCCRRCREPLLLTESSKDPNKATSIMRRLAERADVQAVLIIMPGGDQALTDDSLVRWRFVYPNGEWRKGSLSEWKAQLGALRSSHRCALHALALP